MKKVSNALLTNLVFTRLGNTVWIITPFDSYSTETASDRDVTYALPEKR